MELPRNPDEAKVDPAEFLRQNGAEAFGKLKERAKTSHEYLLAQIPSDTPKEQLPD